jgi:hypothetical protein
MQGLAGLAGVHRSPRLLTAGGNSPRRGGAGVRRRCHGRPRDRRPEVAMIDDGAAPVEAGGGRQQLLRSLGTRNAMLHDFDLWDRGYGHYSELLGTFLPGTCARRRGHGQRPLR